jgi:hypothetical protein
MPITTQPTFESIDSSALADVTGGCGKKRGRCCCPAPAPQPVAAAPSGGSSVDVSVSYGAQTAQATV